MEWVETTGKTVDEAKERALDQLGVARDDAEFDIVEHERTGLFGRLKNEARVRARVKPAQVRPKHDRRRSAGKSKRSGRDEGRSKRDRSNDRSNDGGRGETDSETTASADVSATGSTGGASQDRQRSSSNGQRGRSKRSRTQKEHAGMDDNTGRERHDRDSNDRESHDRQSAVTPQEVGDAATAFMTGLATAFGAEASTEVEIDGTEIDVRVGGDELGLLVGPGGRTLTAVQDLARVSSQRRLGDHETRLRIDIGGYREKRKDALEKFAAAVAAQVVESGSTKALEPMSSADRKIVHDAINEIDGVTSRSDGDDPNRRVVISPA